MQDPDTSSPRVDGSLARDEDGGRRLQWRRTRPDRGVNCARPCRRQRLYFLRVTNFFSSQSSAHAAEYRTSELRRGSYGRRPRLNVMINRKNYYGRNCNPHFWFQRGYLWKCEHVQMDFLQVFPHRAHYQRRRGTDVSPPGALSAPKGEWPCTEAPTMWSCPD